MEYLDRYFQLWDYMVSMQKLLIRSPKRGDGKNIDLKFYGVEYLRVGSAFDGLSVEESSSWPFEDPAPVGLADSKIYILETKYRTDVIVAVQMIVEENDLDIFTSSLKRV
jgi:hypothetical protein